ncbi:MAG: Hsp20/alpha crystallin family protein [Nitrospirae bacterium]|nr:MAG: Hsp20/alpha crystallin family protein [Nitrospirota bacterium]
MMIRRMGGWPMWDEAVTAPFAELDRIRRELSRLVESTLPTRTVRPSAGVYPLLNVSHDADNYYVRAEIPGMNLNDFEVSATGRSVSIAGERKIAPEGEQVKYHRREREGGKFRRQLTLPSDINPDNVRARYQHGILMVILPKANHAKPKKISISE